MAFIGRGETASVNAKHEQVVARHVAEVERLRNEIEERHSIYSDRERALLAEIARLQAIIDERAAWDAS